MTPDYPLEVPVRRPRTAILNIGLALTVGVALGAATPAYAASAVNYVALGDSYSSGLGAGGETGSCLRSPNAYPVLWATAHAPASFVTVACSGATTTSVVNTQVSALGTATTLVSISVGGNDVGFANIMQTCALQGTTACVAAVQAAENFANTYLPGLLDTAYSAISSHAPNARVVVMDYPVFYQLGTFCLGLSATSHAKIDEGINLLDSILSSAASRHGYVFGDVRSIFVGHQLCSGGTKWLHALNILDIDESYHPNSAGQSGGYLPVFSTGAG
jgi:lysophospholipase L1-like esterase